MFNPPASNRRWRTRFSNYEYLSLNPTPFVYLASPSVSAGATSREAHIYAPITIEKLCVKKGKHNRATSIARGNWKIDQAGFTKISGSLSWAANQKLWIQRGTLSVRDL